MDIKQYLDVDVLEEVQAESDGRISSYVNFFTLDQDFDVSQYDLFLIGVPEARMSKENNGCKEAPRAIRNCFYNLYPGNWCVNILDLGDLRSGETIDDTYIALEEIVSSIVKLNKVIMVMGGGHDLITPIYKGHSVLKLPLNFASVDAYLDFQDGENYHSRSFLSHLVSIHENLLSNYSLFGYQTYFCNPSEIELMDSMNFNLIRLGELNSDVKEMEPYIRELNHMSIDASVLKASEAPANKYVSPSGLSSEHLCSLLRYAGMSSSVNSILLSELNPELDVSLKSVMIYSQAMWYFIEGLQHRVSDFPNESENNFKKFFVHSELSDLIFYKSVATNRWWVQRVEDKEKDIKGLFPCSYSDYKKSIRGDLSNRILKYLRFY